MVKSRFAILTGAAAAVLVAGCAARPARSTVSQPLSDDLAQLWVEPEPGRDLYYGPGGSRLAPNPSVVYTVDKVKKGGFSDGYTLLDPRRRQWSAKLYPEARTEVVASRIFWAVGYHQPPNYTLEQWRAEGARSENPQPVARFREEKPDFHGLTEVETWSYFENPFVGTQPYAGLIVLNLMLANSDMRDANNMLYSLAEPVEGARRWYVTRDLGQTFGRTGVFGGMRGALREDVDVFDQTRFITGVENGIVQFEYFGRRRELLEQITPADVRWICTRLSRLTDKQWADAFRAGGYETPTAQRFIRRLKLKIAEGLSVQGS
jgi:hypothetical protein